MNAVYPDLSSETTAIRLAARGPQLALKAHVDAHGSTAARDLYAKAREYDLAYFGGKLGDLMIEIASPASPSALATHEPSSPEGVACVIRIARSVVEAGDALAFDALLHEMVHVFQTVTDAREPGYAGHGPGFAAKCNEIGAQLGLPAVGVKGRAKRGEPKLPDCAQWPLNVRPEGYYGDAPRAGKAVARATKSRTPGRQRRSDMGTHPSDMKADPVSVALAAMAVLCPADQAAVLAQLGLAACPA
jgi:hypothetical protein